MIQSVTTERPGTFRWGYRFAADSRWKTGTTALNERHCYTYMFPESGGRLSFTSTRDVLWATMGYQKPPGWPHDYVFNRTGYWSTPNVETNATTELQVAESIPSSEYPAVETRNTCVDSYIDDRGRTHVLYVFRGPETLGEQYIRHSIVENGAVTKTVQLSGQIRPFFQMPSSPAQFCRLIQDTAGRFYMIGTTAVIPCDSDDGTMPGEPMPMDLSGYIVEYSGISIAAPRGGTPLTDFVDGVFPTGGGTQVVYVRIRLR